MVKYYLESTNSTLRRLQLVLLDMLLEVDRVCKKNDIKYSLIGGTLLGAVRHGGFIPWDDDLDIMMFGDEYLRFREACKRDLDTEKYFFQDHTTDPHYRWGYGRIRRKNSEFIRVGQEHMKMQTGIFLDIFPRDNVPDFPPLRALHAASCFCIRKLLYAEAGTVTGKNAFIRGWYRLLNHIPARVVFRWRDNLAAYWNRRPCKMVRTYTFPTPKGKFGYDRKRYEELAPIEFEGYWFPGVKDYDGYLTYKYGDYMTLPPPEKRHWHPASVIRLPDDEESNAD